jgi:hypothetical protein
MVAIQRDSVTLEGVLPKLVSGEIRVKDAEKFVEADP